MSNTLRDIVSEIATDAKAVSQDDRIPFRYLVSKFLGKLEYFLRLEARSREFAKIQGLWLPIKDEVTLVDASIAGPGFIDNCNNLKRSDCKIPKPLYTNYGLLIKVFSINREFEYQPISSGQFRDYITREFMPKNLRAYYMEGEYLYFPNTRVRAVKVLVIPKDICAIDKLNGTIGDCASSLDCNVNYPDYLITLAKQETIKELFAGYKHEIIDEKGDENTNIKN